MLATLALAACQHAAPSQPQTVDASAQHGGPAQADAPLAAARRPTDRRHMDWVDDPSCAVCSLCSAPASLARETTRRLDVAWLRSRFSGDVAVARKPAG